MDVRIQIQSRYSDVATIVQGVMPLLEDFASEEGVSKVVIGLHEVLHNIMEHGYDGRTDQAIRVWGRRKGRYVVLVIEDDGRPHPRLPRPEPEVICSLEDMAERGRGLWLISQCFTRVRYRHLKGRNQTLLFMRRSKESVPA
jgi:anti-sigma regulatory factor (Ser/Thr protein kinase)